MRKTKKEIILETKEFYESDPSRRAVSSYGTCRYINESGNMCAVGRCLTDDAIKKYGDFEGGIHTLIVEKLHDYGWEEILKEEYRGYDILFWEDLQYFHDRAFLWEENSEEVRSDFVEGLLEKYKD